MISNNNANVNVYDAYVDPLDNFFESFDMNPELMALDEVSYNQRAEKAIFNLEVLDIDKYVKVNELKPVTNPTFFGVRGAPTSDGLLSNEIFGITQKDRAGTFAYIDLYEYFIDPSCYKNLCRLDAKFKSVVAGIGRYKIVDGELVEDSDGDTGIKWLKNNFSKIKFKKTDSKMRDLRIRYIEHNYKLGRLFINKYLVIPPYYRDVNTTGRHAGVGEINTLYVNLLTSVNALKENSDYGLSIADSTCARIQETLKTIYDWFCGNTNNAIKDKGTGLSGKQGIIRSNIHYTSDYSSRLVLTAPELKVDRVEDLMVNMDRSALPLAAVCACFYPFLLYHMRKFFENEFLNKTDYIIVDDKGKDVEVELIDNPMTYFTDDILKDQIKKFTYSPDTRFTPIKLPTKTGDYYMSFTGRPWNDNEDTNKISKETLKANPEPVIHRKMTWLDVIYISAKKATDDKQISITRFPIDSYFNTIYTGIEISTTIQTEKILLNGEYYRFYPKIRAKDINQSSTAKFIDTMQISNLYLSAAGADYDGDTVQVKGMFFKESNEEIKKFKNSKANFTNASCKNVRTSNNEAVQSLYNFTLVLKEDKGKLTEPEF